MFSLQLKQFIIEDICLEIYVPDEASVKELYMKGKISFPYWSQVWPSAQGMSKFILSEPGLIRNKNIVELAAGLGLPSFIASRYANRVICSDYNINAVEVINKTIRHLELKNCSSELLDWNDLPDNLPAEVVLLSDINYDPAVFAELIKLIDRFLSSGSTIILSTPPRLMAKEFVKQLMPFCTGKKDIPVEDVMISVFIFQK